MGPFDPDVVTVFGTLGVLGFTFLIGLYKLKKKELRVREKELEMRGSDPELGPEIEALRDDRAEMQEHTRAQLAEMQERLDFAERLLTAVREDKSG